MTAPPPFDEPPALEAIRDGLKALLPDALPATEETASEVLLGLRGAWARSSSPDDLISRVTGLNKLLVQEVDRVPAARGKDWAQAARIMFGLAVGTKKMGWTARRDTAARQVGYNEDHFRQEVVGRILLQLARQLYQDHQRYYYQADKNAPFQEAFEDSPVLTDQDVASREDSMRSELVARIWEHVYGLRAELVAALRLKAWPDDEENQQDKLDAARGATLWHIANLLALIRRFTDDYGAQIAQSGVEYNTESLIRLAGWRGELPAEQATRMRLILAANPTREEFLIALRSAGIWMGPGQTEP